MSKIPLNRIISDWPVSQEHVLILRESMRTDGQLEPITVWAKGDMFMVANGAHRVEAARQLQWTEVEGNIIVVSEESFWDARIMAATLHQEVANERIVNWIVSAWQASKWGKQGDELKTVAQAIWDVELKAPDRKKWEPIAPDSLPARERELLTWFIRKARKWGRSFDGLKYIIFTYEGWTMNERVDKEAKTKSLSLEERNKLAASVSPEKKPRGPRKLTPKEKESAARTNILAASDELAEIAKRHAQTLQSMADGRILLVACQSRIQNIIHTLWPNEEPYLPAVVEENVKLREQVDGLHKELELELERRQMEESKRRNGTTVHPDVMAVPSSVIEEKGR